MYTAGWPCQPFSREGRGEGLKDARGKLFFPMVARLQQHKETLKCVILENTASLATDKRHEEDFQTVLQFLRSSVPGMQWDWKVVSSLDFGVPQARQRLYVVGWKASEAVLPFSWPARTHATAVPLEAILEPPQPLSQRERVKRVKSLSKTGRRNWTVAKKAIRKDGGDPHVHLYAVDVDSGRQCKLHSYNCARTLTKARGGSGGPWLSNRLRRVTLAEMSRLQGVRISDFNLQGQSNASVGRMRLGFLVCFL